MHFHWLSLVFVILQPKILKGFGGGGVLEIIETNEGGTYRAIYTVKFMYAIFVLHCFQKKSKKGITTPKKELMLF